MMPCEMIYEIADVKFTGKELDRTTGQIPHRTSSSEMFEIKLTLINI